MSEHRPWLGPAHDILKAMCNEWRDSDIRADNREYLRRLNEAFATLTATVERQATRIGELERELADERERAEANWTSLERVKGKLSEKHNELKSAEQQLAERDAVNHSLLKRGLELEAELAERTADLDAARSELKKADHVAFDLRAELAGLRTAAGPIIDRIAGTRRDEPQLEGCVVVSRADIQALASALTGESGEGK